MSRATEVDLAAVRAAVIPAVHRDFRRARRRTWCARAAGGLATLALFAGIALPASRAGSAAGPEPQEIVASFPVSAFQPWQGGDARTWLCSPVPRPTC